MQNLIGKVIDNYKILEEIGRGGIGIVYKALDMNLDKLVVLKMIKPELIEDEGLLKRFINEPKLQAKLESPYIVRVYAFRKTEYGHFIVMEYVDGFTLSDWIKKAGAIPWQKAIPVFKKMLKAIIHAHGVGVIHRDIKPRNVLISKKGEIKISDFGLAKFLRFDSDASITGTIGGTPKYMPPEQIQGLAHVDHRSDIYSLGITLYEMLAGKLPFLNENTQFAIQKAIVDERFPPPTELHPDIPPQLSEIVMKSIEKSPDNRYQRADEMLKAIEAAEGSLKESQNETKSLPSSPPRALPSKRLVLFLVGVIIIIGLAYSLMQMFRNNAPGETAIPEVSKKDTAAIAEETPANQYGTLRIQSRPPGATIRIGNKEAGTTPQKVDSLLEGSQIVQLQLAGYQPWEENVFIHGNRDTLIQVHLQKIEAVQNAVLTLRGVPAAAIFVDGVRKRANSASDVRISVSEGRHTVLFKHPQYGPQEFSVNARAGDNTILTCYFEQYVNIQALADNEPVGAMILIDEKSVGWTPLADYPLRPGTHHVTVQREGYQTIEAVKTINVRPVDKKIQHRLVFNLMKNE